MTADVEFMTIGFQYYVAARSAALAGLLPVSGNLYHHSLEMFLKAGLSKNYCLQQLKKFSHKLIDIWNAFKSEFPNSDLAQFDTTIRDIDEFEELRYPDKILKHGAQMVVDFRGSISKQMSASSPRPEPLYQFYFDDVDRLIWEIFCTSSKNPLFFTSGLKPDVREMLGRDNPVAEQMLGKKNS